MRLVVLQVEDRRDIRGIDRSESHKCLGDNGVSSCSRGDPYAGKVRLGVGAVTAVERDFGTGRSRQAVERRWSSSTFDLNRRKVWESPRLTPVDRTIARLAPVSIQSLAAVRDHTR